jgi:hypothetical protein
VCAVPLPDDPRTPWPPPELERPYAAFDTWQAWYSGDPEELARVYADTIGYGHGNPAIGPEGSILPGGRQRWFWGRRLGSSPDLADARLHVPLPADIAATSADLLFAEQPGLRVDGEDGGPGGKGPRPTTDRLDMLMIDGGLLPVLIEAAEIAAAASGVYLRAGWNDDIADHVIIDAITPDCAVPEWAAGRMLAVTLWHRLPGGDNDQVWRHLERHEAADGTGRILHALYEGTDTEIGQLTDLAAHPDTARLAKAAEAAPDSDGRIRQIITGAARPAVEWLPNMRPPRRLRRTPYGRSDFDGIEPVLDAIDETFSSWMRDLRIGKGRIVVPESYLQGQGRGRGAMFDAEQAIFTAVDALTPNDSMALTPVQFAIRVAEHRETAVTLIAQALRGAGYATQTFGEAGETAATATEVVARERRSYVTRGRKILYWRTGLARLLETALQIDCAHYSPDGVTPVRPIVQFPDGVAQDPQAVAQTIALINGAEAASLYTRIKLFNPDWTDPEIREEMDRIRGDQQATRLTLTPAIPPPGAGTGAAVPEEETPAQGGPGATGSEQQQPGEPGPAEHGPPAAAAAVSGRRRVRRPPTRAGR